MSTADAVLLLNAAATGVMVGVIWFVQLVHYPLFAEYGVERYPATMAAHQRRTTRVVFPPMIAELLTAAALVWLPPAGVPAWQAWLGLGLVGVWGFSTALVQIPLHDRLERAGPDPAAVRRLVLGNWLRTAAWTARGAVVLVMLAERLSVG